MTHTLDVPPLFAALHGSVRVLIAGAGGGFDVHLANLSFTQLELVDRDHWIAPDLVEVTPVGSASTRSS